MATSLDIFDNGGLEIFGDFYKNLTVEDLFGITNGQTDFFGDIGVNGALTMELLATPSAPTITNAGTAGATTYGYKVVATVASTSTDASTEGTTTTGNATLSATNYNIISWAKVNGATGYKVYRTTGGSTPPMLIATITNGNTVVYNDTDKTSGSSEVPSTTNATGALNVHTLVFVTSYSITGNLVAGADDTYTIGDATHRWKDIFASDTVQLGVVDAADTEPLLHVRKATAGTVNSLANTIAVLENSTTNYLSFLRPANASAGLVFGTPTSNTRSWMIMYGDTDATYPDYFELALAGSARLRYVAGAFGFVEAVSISSTAKNGMNFDDPAKSMSAGATVGRVNFKSTNAVTVQNTQTWPVMATVIIDEPNLIKTNGTITVATSLYVSGVPTEGTSNYAAYFNGNIYSGSIIQFANARLFDSGAGDFRLTNVDGTAYSKLNVGGLGTWSDLTFQEDALAINAPNADNNYTIIKARDTGVGVVEIARMAGAADPYFSMGGTQQFKFTNAGLVGFFAATPVAQQTGCAVPTDLATAITAITALRTALNNLGLTTVV